MLILWWAHQWLPVSSRCCSGMDAWLHTLCCRGHQEEGEGLVDGGSEKNCKRRNQEIQRRCLWEKKMEEKGEPHKKAPRSWKSHKEQSGNLMFPSFYRHHSLGGRGHSPFKEPKNRHYMMNDFGEAESLLSSFPLRKEITVTILGVYEVNQHSSKKKKQMRCTHLL